MNGRMKDEVNPDLRLVFHPSSFILFNVVGA
jgi:hypothetical protein